MSKRIRLRVKSLGNFESGILLKGENGELYQWFTKSYTSPLFYATDDEWYEVSATHFTFDHPTPKNGLKNVRVIKNP